MYCYNKLKSNIIINNIIVMIIIIITIIVIVTILIIYNFDLIAIILITSTCTPTVKYIRSSIITIIGLVLVLVCMLINEIIVY